jgi:stearoyl-CoA desaturase (delta-9 desaturase)
MAQGILKRVAVAFVRWFDTSAGGPPVPGAVQKTDWVRVIPYAAVHLMCLGVIWVGWSPIAVGVAAAMYFIRMFAITGFYHRYFSHRSFKTTRLAQFVFAVMGNASVQRGPLWWASHHRLHHQRSDEPTDVHSPVQHGFIWSHIGWITSESNFAAHLEMVRDLTKFPELKFLDRFDVMVPTALGFGMFALGTMLNRFAPSLHTTGSQMLIWGFFISTVVLAHGTFTINSLAHVFGRRRYETSDSSRNSFALAMVTLGEGWHNNHHHYPAAARQGFFWWEIDITFYLLKALEGIGIIWDVRAVPEKVLYSDRLSAEPRAAKSLRPAVVALERGIKRATAARESDGARPQGVSVEAKGISG